MEIDGKLKVIYDQVQVSQTFRKRQFVLATDEQYPQFILIELAQDKCDFLNNFQVGQDVKVSINLRGREWTSPQGEVKYFNQIQGWKIELQNAGAAATNTNPETTYTAEPYNDTDEEHDDLPF